MSQRFYVDAAVVDSVVEMQGQEFQHLTKVMRAAPGDACILFDGSGAEFTAIVKTVERRKATLQVVSKQEVSRESPVVLTLAVALPKGDRQKVLVEKAVELGVARLIPLQTERSVAKAGTAVERLRRGVIEASKQCGRNRLMQISDPQTFQQMLQKTATTPTKLLAHPQGDGLIEAIGSLPLKGVIAAVGPEGGFSNEEAAEASEAGWKLIGLGPRILRIETAAMLLAATLC